MRVHQKGAQELVEAIIKKAIPTTTRKNPGVVTTASWRSGTATKRRKKQRRRGNQWFKDRYNEAQKLKDTVVESKRASWRSFAGTFEARTPRTKILNTLRAIDGRKKSRRPNQPIRQDANTFITDRSKAEGAVRLYVQICKVQIRRANEKDAYMTYRGCLKTEGEDMDLHAPGPEHTPAQDQSISTWPGQSANANAAQSHRRRQKPPFASV